MNPDVSFDWAWYLLDQDDQEIRALESVPYGATLEFNSAATIRGGGEVTVLDAGEDIDWLTVRLQPRFVNLETGEETPWGVFLPVVPETEYTPVSKSWKGTLLDKTQVLNGWTVAESYAVAAGVNVVGEVTRILANAGQSRVAATPSSKTTVGPLVWDPNTSLLRIVNDLLDSINYRALWVDRMGVFRVEPYVLPQDRLIVGEFVEGESAFHRGDFTVAQDRTSVPNHVVCVGQANGSDAPLIGEALNEDPSSPFSIPRRGFRVSKAYENVEASDQATITALARRRLVELSTPALTVKRLSHAVVPMDLADVAVFRSQGVNVVATVERQALTLTPGQLMQSDLRAVTL